MNRPTVSAASQGLVSCHVCYNLAAAREFRCARCGSLLHRRKKESLQRTLALLVTACVLYIPANLYPIMYTDHFGSTDASTILGGIVLLIEVGELPIALIIFLFSVMVPTGKLMTLFYLVWSIERKSGLDARQRSQMYRITEFIGKWSMVDVFVVAILAALVHLGGLLVVRPGIAAVSFCGVVIITMLAAETFDSRLIWDKEEETQRDV